MALCVAVAAFHPCPLCVAADSQISAVDTATAASDAEVVALTPEATEFIRGMILLLVPKSVAEDDDWGRTTRVQSGLNVRLKDGQLRTSRRWKNVNHGLWSRAEVSLIEPEKNFTLSISILPPADNGNRRFQVNASTKLHIYGRQQQWNYGLRLFSVSAKGTARLSLSGIVQLGNEVVSEGGTTRLRIMPQLEDADILLSGFQLHSVSHMKGAAVREFGRSVRSLVERQVSNQEKRIVAKINQKIQATPEKFELSLGLLNVLVGSPKTQPADTTPNDVISEDVPPLIIPP
jgi:hypothetical protein